MSEVTEPVVNADLEALADRAWAEAPNENRIVHAAKAMRDQTGMPLREIVHLLRAAEVRTAVDAALCRTDTERLAQVRRERDTALVRADNHRAAAHKAASQFEAQRREIERLRRIVNLVAELTHDTDGCDLDPDTDIPVGEVMRALAGESA